MKKRQMIKVGLLASCMSLAASLKAYSIGVVTADQLNIRNTPSMTGNVVMQVNSGASLEIVRKEKNVQGWYEIRLGNDQIAYAKDEFIKIASVGGTVIENNLNFRSYPSLTKSTVMGKLPLGTEVTVLYRVGDFYKVLYQGNFGFVYASYVDVAFPECVMNQPIESVKDVANIQTSTFVSVADQIENTYPVTGPLSYEEHLAMQMGNMSETSGTPITCEKGIDIVCYATQFVGNPYVYGGNDLITGVDCSGFTQQVMKAFNLSIPRTSKDQSRVGMLVTSLEALQPGDLLFFGNSIDEINHVAIYIGDNYMVHASTPETGIIISQLNERGFATLQVVRRMVE